MNKLTSLFCSVGLLGLVQQANAAPVPVDLSLWSVEGTGTWNLQSVNNPNDSVKQTVNGNPTVYISPGNAQGTAISGKIKVEPSGDDDFIGFVLGYHSGDLTNSSANYLLIDWKQGNQNYHGCGGLAGLSISSVTGALGDNSGAWCHDPVNNVTELARADNLGSTGWVDNTEYDFDITFNPNNVIVNVNGIEEININGTFADGSVGFYNYSQANVVYSALEERAAPPQPGGDVPEPATLGLFGLGLAALGLGLRRRKSL